MECLKKTEMVKGKHERHRIKNVETDMGLDMKSKVDKTKRERERERERELC
jgi:hypothetical protein